MSGIASDASNATQTGPQQVFYDPAYGGFVMANPAYNNSPGLMGMVGRTMEKALTGKDQDPYLRINYTDPNQRFQSPSNPYVPSVADLFPQMNPMQAQVNPMSFGAARFLQGNTSPVTLDYSLPMGSAIPQFNMPRFKPGAFYNDYEAKIRNDALAEAAGANTIQAAMDAGTMGTG